MVAMVSDAFAGDVLHGPSVIFVYLVYHSIKLLYSHSHPALPAWSRAACDQMLEPKIQRVQAQCSCLFQRPVSRRSVIPGLWADTNCQQHFGGSCHIDWVALHAVESQSNPVSRFCSGSILGVSTGLHRLPIWGPQFDGNHVLAGCGL